MFILNLNLGSSGAHSQVCSNATTVPMGISIGEIAYSICTIRVSWGSLYIMEIAM